MSASSAFWRYFSKRYLRDVFFSAIRYKSAVGIDRINTKIFESNLSFHIDTINKKVRGNSYHFSQYREKLILRGPDKRPRAISIPTIRDKLVLKSLFDILHSVYGPGPFLHSIIREVAEVYTAGIYKCILRLDIENFYPTVKHDILLKCLRKKIRKKEILGLIIKSLETATVSKPDKHLRNDTGLSIPQGLSISNILANIYMSVIDHKNGRCRDYKYFRYVDDILVFCNEDNQQSIRDQLDLDFRGIGLKTHGPDSEKSNSCAVSEGFSYLGYAFKDSKISVREKSINTLRESIIKTLTNFKYSRTHDISLLGWALNLRITGCIFNGTKYGWLFFFSQINDLELLFSLDHFVIKQLKRFGLDPSQIGIKKFIRAYHEITKNISASHYIPNFDKLDISAMRYILSTIFKYNAERMDAGQIKYQFNKCIYRKIRDLERDLGRPS